MFSKTDLMMNCSINYKPFLLNHHVWKTFEKLLKMTITIGTQVALVIASTLSAFAIKDNSVRCFKQQK